MAPEPPALSEELVEGESGQELFFPMRLTLPCNIWDCRPDVLPRYI